MEPAHHSIEGILYDGMRKVPEFKLMEREFGRVPFFKLPGTEEGKQVLEQLLEKAKTQLRPKEYVAKTTQYVIDRYLSIPGSPESRQAFSHWLGTLEEHEMDVIDKRYGLGLKADREKRTIESVGADYGVHYGKIREIQSRAERKLIRNRKTILNHLAGVAMSLLIGEKGQPGENPQEIDDAIFVNTDALVDYLDGIQRTAEHDKRIKRSEALSGDAGHFIAVDVLKGYIGRRPLVELQRRLGDASLRDVYAMTEEELSNHLSIGPRIGPKTARAVNRGIESYLDSYLDKTGQKVN